MTLKTGVISIYKLFKTTHRRKSRPESALKRPCCRATLSSPHSYAALLKTRRKER